MPDDKYSLRCWTPAAGPRLATVLSLQEPEGISGEAGHLTQARSLCGALCGAPRSLCIPGVSLSLRQLVANPAAFSLSNTLSEVRVQVISEPTAPGLHHAGNSSQ